MCIRDSFSLGRIASDPSESINRKIVQPFNVLIVNGEKIRPSAMTVPKSLMKHAARIDLPYLV